MYLVSHYAGWGRNFCQKVENGTINVYAGGEQLHVRVENGLVVEHTIRANDEYTSLRYGQGLETKKQSKTVKEEYYEPGTLQAIRRGNLWKRETGIKLCKNQGKVECYSTSSGAFGKEVFTYSNGNQGYIATRWRKKLKVKRPNGKLWIIIEGQISLSRYPIAENLDPESSDFGLWRFMQGQNWSITVYDTDGAKVITQGHVKNRQKQGKWLEQDEVSYYMSGVKVSRELHEENPDKWNAREVLRIPNSQLRCSLLNRMGYDKLLEKVKGKIIEESDDGGQLLEIDTGVADGSARSLDKIMRLIKVICPSTRQVYVLRVPPEISNYEQARQWTFGVRQESIREGASLELAKET